MLYLAGSLNQELKDKNAIGDEELPVHIPDPKEYSGDCSSVFEWQVNSFISQIEMDKTSDHLNQICKDVESIFAPILPGVRPVIFGSCLTGLAFKNSDLDIFMECCKSFHLKKLFYVEIIPCVFWVFLLIHCYH